MQKEEVISFYIVLLGQDVGERLSEMLFARDGDELVKRRSWGRMCRAQAS